MTAAYTQDMAERSVSATRASKPTLLARCRKGDRAWRLGLRARSSDGEQEAVPRTGMRSRARVQELIGWEGETDGASHSLCRRRSASFFSFLVWLVVRLVSGCNGDIEAGQNEKMMNHCNGKVSLRLKCRRGGWLYRVWDRYTADGYESIRGRWLPLCVFVLHV